MIQPGADRETQIVSLTTTGHSDRIDSGLPAPSLSLRSPDETQLPTPAASKRHRPLSRPPEDPTRSDAHS